MRTITKEWLNSARDDLKIMEIIIQDESLTHQVAFHAQQAIEKSFKAIIEEFETGFIKTHSLETLFGKTKGLIPFDISLELMRELDQLYIDARYPGDFGLLSYGKPGKDDALKFQKAAVDFYDTVEKYLTKQP